MIIAETSSFEVGPFTVRQRPRFDNPAFSSYTVFRGERLIGKSFSRPDIGCCEWLERDGRDQAAKDRGKPTQCAHAIAGGEATAKKWGKRGRPSNAAREAREASLLQDLAE